MQINNSTIYTKVSTNIQAEKDVNSCKTQESKIQSFINSQENFKYVKRVLSLVIWQHTRTYPALEPAKLS